MSAVDEALIKLDTANKHLSKIELSTAATNQSVKTGLAALAQLVEETNARLDYEIKQNATIICNLEKITRQTCALVNEAALQTIAQQSMQVNTIALRQLYELSNPAATVEQGRLDALKKEIEECCPPPKHVPPCKYKACPDPGDPPRSEEPPKKKPPA